VQIKYYDERTAEIHKAMSMYRNLKELLK